MNRQIRISSDGDKHVWLNDEDVFIHPDGRLVRKLHADEMYVTVEHTDGGIVDIFHYNFAKYKPVQGSGS